MFKSLYRRLAESSLKRHRNLFVPFIGTGIFLMVLTGLCISLLGEESLKDQKGMGHMGTILFMTIFVMLLFSLITLSSVYSFIQKRKLKESGLLLTLGLEKQHLRKILAWEMFYLSLMIGIPSFFLTAIFHKLSLALFIKIGDINIDPFANGIIPDLRPLLMIALAYLIIFLCLLLKEFIHTTRFTPIGLINEAKAGDKKESFPRIKALLGLFCLLAGYGISIFTKNPIASINLFLPAALLVIIGTYLAFGAIISWALNFLRSKKDFYYRKENFASISGLLYRMKNSSKSLANITILSTAVTVIMTSGISLYLGTEERAKEFIPADYVVTLYNAQGSEAKDLETYVRDYLKSEGLSAQVKAFQSVNLPVIMKDGHLEKVEREKILKGSEDVMGLQFVYAPEANLDFGGKDLIWLKSDPKKEVPKLGLNESVKTIEQDQSYIKFPSKIVIYYIHTFYVSSSSQMETMINTFSSPQESAFVENKIYINRREQGDQWQDFTYRLREGFKAKYPNLEVDLKLEDRDYDIQESKSIYGSIFYVGILLGLSFLASTGLAIYYKQLTEGYADIDRFRILRQVGMTDQEAKNTIKKQIRLVFILPLIFSFMHTCFVYPILRRILIILGMFNDELFIRAMIGVFILFMVFYFVTFKLTEKVYQKLVLR